MECVDPCPFCIAWCRVAKIEPFLVLNMGTGTLREALNWIEYCNGTGDTYVRNRTLGVSTSSHSIGTDTMQISVARTQGRTNRTTSNTGLWATKSGAGGKLAKRRRRRTLFVLVSGLMPSG